MRLGDTNWKYDKQKLHVPKVITIPPVQEDYDGKRVLNGNNRMVLFQKEMRQPMAFPHWGNLEFY